MATVACLLLAHGLRLPIRTEATPASPGPQEAVAGPWTEGFNMGFMAYRL